MDEDLKNLKEIRKWLTQPIFNPRIFNPHGKMPLYLKSLDRIIKKLEGELNG